MIKRFWRVGDGIPLVLLTGAAGALLVLQGWKSRIPNFDMVSTIDAAQALAKSGRIPDRGVLTSFTSFTPPGAAWLMAPGVLIFHDPRLFEYVGSVGLYLGTLLGIFLLARRALDRPSAMLAVVLYAFSGLGISAASTLWQRYPIHCFAVWTVYSIARWADGNSPRWLAAALLTWAAGMYVFLEIAPLVLAIPAVWIVRRPTVRAVPLLAAAVLALGVWYPYLRFEDARRFLDIRSQLLRKPVLEAHVNATWCEPRLLPDGWKRGAFAEVPATSASTSSTAARTAGWFADRVRLAVSELVFANFTINPAIPGAGATVLLLTLSGLGVLLASTLAAAVGGPPATWHRSVGRCAAGLAVLAIFANEWILARYLAPDGVLEPSSRLTIRALQITLLAAAVALAACRSRIAAAMVRIVAACSSPARSAAIGAVALSLAIPWLSLFLVADGERRFWWLWPLQAIALAAAVGYVPPRIGVPGWTVRLCSNGLAVLVAANTVVVARVSSWHESGWPGRDAMEVELADRVAALVRADGHDRASIGYEVDIWQFMALFNVADPRYKVGADLDLLLKYRDGIVNQDQCAEGVSADDSYRVVQVAPRAMASASGSNRIPAIRGRGFTSSQHAGVYEIFRHTRAPHGDAAAETP